MKNLTDKELLEMASINLTPEVETELIARGYQYNNGEWD